MIKLNPKNIRLINGYPPSCVLSQVEFSFLVLMSYQVTIRLILTLIILSITINTFPGIRFLSLRSCTVLTNIVPDIFIYIPDRYIYRIDIYRIGIYTGQVCTGKVMRRYSTVLLIISSNTNYFYFRVLASRSYCVVCALALLSLVASWRSLPLHDGARCRCMMRQSFTSTVRQYQCPVGCLRPCAAALVCRRLLSFTCCSLLSFYSVRRARLHAGVQCYCHVTELVNSVLNYRLVTSILSSP